MQRIIQDDGVQRSKPAARERSTMWAGRSPRGAASFWVAALILLTVCATPVSSAAEETATTQRPRIGLVLGGGGARGAAHVGVLKVMQELRIPVDCVAGTSMGSVVGGLYASGMNAEEIEREIRAMNWDDLFQDDTGRKERSFRRKRDDDSYAFKAKVGVNNGEIKMPLALIRGQKFDLMLNRLTLPVVGINDFDRLPVPFRAVATDLETGKQVVLGKGNLAQSIRASLAVPAAFDPVEIDGRLLVDGGMTNNVPVSVARDMCADVFIVVDVGSGLLKRDQINSAVDVTFQLTSFLTNNTGAQLATLGLNDVLINPVLGDIGSGDFNRAGETIPIGERAARAQIDALRRYSINEQDYAQYQASRASARSDALEIEFVRAENHSRIGDAVITARISAEPGKPLDIDQVEKDIGNVYGLGNFSTVRYDVVSENGAKGLVISAQEKYWGPGYLQFGLTTSNNMEGDSTYDLGFMYTQTGINSLNGEWRTAVQLGQEPGLFTELYQPLDPRGRYFLSGMVGYQNEIVNVYDDDNRKLAEVNVTSPQVELGAGRNFGAWGEGRVGYRWGDGEGEVISGVPAPDFDVGRGDAFVRLSVDTFDNLNFPRSGQLGALEMRTASEGMGATTDYDQVQFTYDYAHTWGANTLIGSLSGGSTMDDNAPLEGLFELGGFLRLSGFNQDELSGQNYGLAGLAYMRRLGWSIESYAGASLELGNVWQDSDDVSFDSALTAGSVFLGIDTPIGPLYLGYGLAEGSNKSVYIYLGPRFTLF